MLNYLLRMKKCLDGLVLKTSDWKKEIDWVGKNGLIIFDDVGFGTIQDNLRKNGYSVIGNSEDGDRLELDRTYAQEILESLGVFKKDFETKKFTIDGALNFILKNKGEWVIKQNDHNTALNYVGNITDGSDSIGVLQNYKKFFGGNLSISLQKKVTGVEVAIGRFFNGVDWVGPCVINFEHKHLCNDDIGPLGGETGTLMWYDDNENSKLFKRSLANIKPHLQKSGYKGYVDINCIVNKNELYPLEITSRFGSSTIETQEEIHISTWGNLFTAMAKGNNFKLKYKKGYSINVALTVPPFPYRTNDLNIISNNENIFFKKNMTKNDFSHIHFEGAYSVNKKYFTTGNLGYVLYVTGTGKSVIEARKKVYRIINKIIIPKMFYRTDIGLRFINKDEKILKKWGWI